MDVDSLVTLWAGSGYRPRPPRPHADVDAFAVEVRRRFALRLPGDYLRFLTLTDGGQFDHAIFCGVGPDDPVLGRCADLRTGSILVIGSSGNVDAYVLRADGRADIVNLFDLDEVAESYPSFTALLRRMIVA